MRTQRQFLEKLFKTTDKTVRTLFGHTFIFLLHWGTLDIVLFTCNLECFEIKKGIMSCDGVSSINVTMFSAQIRNLTSCVSSAQGFYCNGRLFTSVNDGTKT